jgi:hypothetical protein
MKTEHFDNAADFMAAVSGSKRRASSRARVARPDIPRAGRAASTGLTTFLKAGWNWTYDVRFGYRLDKGALTSGWAETEAAACAKARGL